jgi:hypothetical protein
MIDEVNERKPQILIEVLPHPRFKGDWLVRCDKLQPYPIWFKSREHAISYADIVEHLVPVPKMAL